ncbi:MAG: toast rack family protein [Bryobacteraceae bacterium]
MTSKSVRKASLFALAPLLLSLTACTFNVGQPVGETRTETRSVDLPKAEIVHAEIKMAAGELTLRGGAEKLMEGEFRYNVDSWKPEVKYEQTGFRGQLSVAQTGASGTTGTVVNNWTVKLNDSMATDLDASLGAGEARLDLGGLTLRSVNVKMGAGQTEIKFSSAPKHSFDLNIRGGVGEATVRIPKDVGAIAKAKGGIGEISVHGMTKEADSWVNESYGRAKVAVRVDVQGGIGQINIYSE